MMIIILMIVFFIATCVFGVLAIDDYGEYIKVKLFLVSLVLAIITFVFGVFHGWLYYPATEGTHIGTITAVDLEGVYFRRYEVYLKSEGTTNDEDKYLIYDYEKELADTLKENIGKKVKLHYGHDGGYIAWNSCGTWHIKSVEVLEGE